MPDRRLSFIYPLLSLCILALLLAGVVHSFYTFDHEWDFNVILPYIWMTGDDGTSSPGLFLQGLWMTVRMSFQSIILGTIIGFLIGALLLSKERISRAAAIIYVDIFRNTPLLVQLYIAYFIIGTAFNWTELTTALMGLSLFCAAYVAEIFRSTIANFDKGQVDAAKSIGLNPIQVWCLVIAPQALRRMLPPLVNQFVSLIKDSSLLSVIAIPELTKEAQNAITVTLSSYEIYFFVALMYLIVNTCISSLGRYLENRLSKSLQ